MSRLTHIALAAAVVCLPARGTHAEAALQAPAVPVVQPEAPPAVATPEAAPPAGAPDAPGTLVLSVDDAIALALHDNFGLSLARNDLAASQSSLLAAQDAFHFKLKTSFADGRTFQRNRLVEPPAVPPATPVSVRRDVLDDDQLLGLRLEKAEPWGGSFAVETDLSRSHLRFAPGLDPVHTSTTALSLRLPLWGGRGRRIATSGLVSARTGLLDASRSLAEREMRTVVEVTRAFYGVVRSARFIEIDRDAAVRAAENLRTYRLRLEEGLITPIDVARAESETKSRENQVVADEESHASARDRLLLLLGQPIDTTFRTVSSPRLESVDVELRPAIDEALAQRVDLRNQRDAVELSGLSADVARSGVRPRLDLTVGAGFATVQGDTAAKWLDLADDDTWTSGIALNYTFGEHSDNEALVRALIGQESSRVRLSELERSVVLEVRDAVRNVRSLERQIELLKENVDLARETLRLASLQLEEDLIRTTELLQIQAALVRAETDYTGALYDHEVARVNLELVLGRYRTAGDSGRSEFLRDLPSVAPDFAPWRAPAAAPGGTTTPEGAP